MAQMPTFQIGRRTWTRVAFFASHRQTARVPACPPRSPFSRSQQAGGPPHQALAPTFGGRRERDEVPLVGSQGRCQVLGAQGRLWREFRCGDQHRSRRGAGRGADGDTGTRAERRRARGKAREGVAQEARAAAWAAAHRGGAQDRTRGGRGAETGLAGNGERD
eukprot:5297046-Prymnesium_polylepis.1